jgi:hypothetical protein
MVRVHDADQYAKRVCGYSLQKSCGVSLVLRCPRRSISVLRINIFQVHPSLVDKSGDIAGGILFLSTDYDVGYNGTKWLPRCNCLFDLTGPVGLTFRIDRAAEQIMIDAIEE